METITIFVTRFLQIYKSIIGKGWLRFKEAHIYEYNQILIAQAIDYNFQ